MKKIVSFILIFICLFSGCSCKKDEEEFVKTSIFSAYIKAYKNKISDESTFVSPFGTYVSLVGYNKKKVNDAEDEFNELVEKYHSLLDRNYYYKDDDGNYINNVRVINDSYGSNSSVVVDDILIEVLKEGVKYTKLSNGKFNIFSGSIVDLWDNRFEILHPDYGVDPSEEEINNAMKCVVKVEDIDNVFIIDEENSTVMFNKFEGCENGASITLGALAKSYFLDKLSDEETFINIGSAIYDAGQSSIILKGDNPTRESKEWFIAVKDSLNGGNAIQIKVTKDNAISTSSGDYKGYIKDDGTRRHHIIDATRGYPGQYLLATTVIGKSAMIVDIITTTLMSMNKEEIEDYLKSLSDIGINVSVLLQVEEDNKLVIYADSDMNEFFGTVYNDLEVKVLDYGA